MNNINKYIDFYESKLKEAAFYANKKEMGFVRSTMKESVEGLLDLIWTTETNGVSKKNDFIRASAIMSEFAIISDPSATSPSERGMRSPASAMVKDGIAIASSPSGDPTPKRAVVWPLVEDKLFD